MYIIFIELPKQLTPFSDDSDTASTNNNNYYHHLWTEMNAIDDRQSEEKRERWGKNSFEYVSLFRNQHTKPFAYQAIATFNADRCFSFIVCTQIVWVNRIKRVVVVFEVICQIYEWWSLYFWPTWQSVHFDTYEKRARDWYPEGLRAFKLENFQLAKNVRIENCIYFWSKKYNEIAIICLWNYQENQKNWEPTDSIESIVCKYTASFAKSHKKLNRTDMEFQSYHYLPYESSLHQEWKTSFMHRMSSCCIFIIFHKNKWYNRIEIKIDLQLMLFY